MYLPIIPAWIGGEYNNYDLPIQDGLGITIELEPNYLCND